jgi:hypothetical protein
MNGDTTLSIIETIALALGLSILMSKIYEWYIIKWCEKVSLDKTDKRFYEYASVEPDGQDVKISKKPHIFIMKKKKRKAIKKAKGKSLFDKEFIRDVCRDLILIVITIYLTRWLIG